MLGRAFVSSRCDVRRGLAEGWRIRAAGSARQERRLRRGLAFAAALALPAALLVTQPLAAQQGARVTHRNLAQMVSDSHTIVHGRVLSARAEPHPQYTNLMTVVVSLEVIELLKGQSGAPFSFRQFVWNNRDVQDKLGYKTGDEVLLLLLRPHSDTGLSSPAGVQQGRFRISRDAQANRQAENGLRNGALFRGMDPVSDSTLQTLNVQARTTVQQHRSGPIPYDQLRSIIQALAANSN